MSDDKDNLKSIKVYKFDNTKERWHEFALKYRVIADTEGMRRSLMAQRTRVMKRKTMKYLKKMMQIRKRQNEKSW